MVEAAPVIAPDVLSSTYFFVAADVSPELLSIVGNVTIPVKVGFTCGALAANCVCKVPPVSPTQKFNSAAVAVIKCAVLVPPKNKPSVPLLVVIIKLLFADSVTSPVNVGASNGAFAANDVTKPPVMLPSVK